MIAIRWPGTLFAVLGNACGAGVLALDSFYEGRSRALEVRTNATGPLELLNEVWSVLSPQFRVAAAVFAPLKLADAGIRQASS